MLEQIYQKEINLENKKELLKANTLSFTCWKIWERRVTPEIEAFKAELDDPENFNWQVLFTIIKGRHNVSLNSMKKANENKTQTVKLFITRKNSCLSFFS